MYGQLIFDKSARAMQWRDKLLNKWCWDNWTYIYTHKKQLSIGAPGWLSH